MLSFYSFFVAIVWLNAVLFLVAFLSRKTSFLVKHSTTLLLCSVALGISRALLPLDFSFTYVINSFTVMSFLHQVMKTPVVQAIPAFTVARLLIGLWIAGASVVLAKTGFRLAREQAVRRSYCFAQNKVAEGVFARMHLKNATLYVSPDVCTPMMTGVFHAHIFVPDLQLTQEQWTSVFRHEYQHYKSCDIGIKLFYLLLQAALWWNPVVHWFRTKLDYLLELRCDANVTRLMQDESKEQYLYSILTVARQLRENSAYAIGTAAFASAQSGAALKQRFQLVLSEKKPTATARRAGMAVLTVLFLLSFLVVVQPAGYPKGDKTETGYFIEPKNAYVVITPQGKFELYADGDYVFDLMENELDEEPFSTLPIYEGELQ